MRKRTAIWILLVSLVLLCAGCSSEESAVVPETTGPRMPPLPSLPEKVNWQQEPELETRPEWVPEETYQADKTGYVVFKLSAEQVYIYVPREYILHYESRMPECNGTWFRDLLSEEDRCIYNAYLYAMENQMTWFELYVEDNDKDWRYLREAVSLGSPFMEQNYNRYGERTTDLPSDYLGERLWVHIPQYADKRWSMKMEALDRCREIVAGIPEEYTTQEEKMEYLYRYVVDHVEYVMYEQMADEDYLYDAVCLGRTVCDGYSNMLNLLFCLIGVESYEVMGSNYPDLAQLTPEELETAAGHTWVAARIGDQFYNFDPTFEDTDEGCDGENLRYFGFSDDLVSVKYLDCEDLRPQCTDISRDGSMADILINNREDHTEIREAAQQLDDRMDSGITDTTLLIRNVFTEDPIREVLNSILGNTQKLEQKVYLQIRCLRNASLVTVHAEPR